MEERHIRLLEIQNCSGCPRRANVTILSHHTSVKLCVRMIPVKARLSLTWKKSRFLVRKRRPLVTVNQLMT